jgi:hypothetical protein
VDLAAVPATAKELVLAIGFEAGNSCAGRHGHAFEYLARLRIDVAQVAFFAFPRAMPQLAVEPGDTGDKTVGIDGVQDRTRLRIDLVDLAATMLPYPERAFGPGQPGIASLAR